MDDLARRENIIKIIVMQARNIGNQGMEWISLYLEWSGLLPY